MLSTNVMRTSKHSSVRIFATLATLMSSLALLVAAPSVQARDDSTGENSSSSQVEQETGEPDFGTDYYDFRCINDAWRLNQRINYHREGTPLPTGPTIVVELDQAGCEILGNDEGGVAYCRCQEGILDSHFVPASWLPTLQGGTDDLYRLAPVCVRAVREFCGVEPKDVPEPDITGPGITSSSSGDEESISEETTGIFETGSDVEESDDTSTEEILDTSGDSMTETGPGKDVIYPDKKCGVGASSDEQPQMEPPLPIDQLVGCTANESSLKEALVLPILALFLRCRRRASAGS